MIYCFPKFKCDAPALCKDGYIFIDSACVAQICEIPVKAFASALHRRECDGWSDDDDIVPTSR